MGFGVKDLMPNAQKPQKRRPAPPRVTRAAPRQSLPRDGAGTRALATRVFRQLLEEKAAPETIVDGLRAAGVDPAALGELLRAVRACIGFADDLPEEVQDFDADDLTDYLTADEGVDPDVAFEVVEAFFSLGEEA